MKTVTAKEFQLNQSHVMKQAAKGVIYQITFHGKPWVELHPGVKRPAKAPVGSLAAFRESLRFSLSGEHLPTKPDYKALRQRHLTDKYGK